MSNTQKGLLFAITTPVLWGMMSLPIRILKSYGISPTDMVFFRCLISGTGLFILNWIFSRDTLRVDLKGLLLCVLYGSFSYATSFTAYTFAVQRIPVAVAMVLMFLCPVWVSLLNLLVFKERLKMINSVSIVICLIGAIMVSNIIAVKGEKIDLIGIICALINGLGAGLQLIIPRYFEKSYKKDTFVVYGFLGSALILSLFFKGGEVAEAFAAAPVSVAANIFFLSAICTLVANSVFVKAGTYLDSTLVSIISALEVVVGSLLGFFVFRESLSFVQSLGAVIIVIGALLPNLTMLAKKNALN